MAQVCDPDKRSGRAANEAKSKHRCQVQKHFTGAHKRKQDLQKANPVL